MCFGFFFPASLAAIAGDQRPPPHCEGVGVDHCPFVMTIATKRLIGLGRSVLEGKDIGHGSALQAHPGYSSLPGLMPGLAFLRREFDEKLSIDPPDFGDVSG